MLFCHSREVGAVTVYRDFRCDVKASHKMYRNRITARIEIMDPSDETMFHVRYASG